MDGVFEEGGEEEETDELVGQVRMLSRLQAHPRCSAEQLLVWRVRSAAWIHDLTCLCGGVANRGGRAVGQAHAGQ